MGTASPVKGRGFSPRAVGSHGALALQRLAGNRTIRAVLQRAVLADEKVPTVRFTVGVEIAAPLAAVAWNRTTTGALDDAALGELSGAARDRAIDALVPSSGEVRIYTMILEANVAPIEDYDDLMSVASFLAWVYERSDDAGGQWRLDGWQSDEYGEYSGFATLPGGPLPDGAA